MIPKDDINLKYVRSVFLRRFWYIVLSFFVLFTGAIVHCITAPRIYKSRTLILVQPQEIPSDYVQSTVTSDTTSRLNTLREQVMSRPKLEEIIRKYDLYVPIRTAGTMYDAVRVMREHIDVQVTATRGRHGEPGSFEISYEGQEPAKVRDATAAIANLFIEDDLKLREQQATGTLTFLDRQLARVREELREKEELVRQFKEDNFGSLPEQMENNYRILTQLQQHLDSINSNLQQTEDRRLLLRGQISRLEAMRTTPPQASDREGSPLGPETPLSLEELQQQLESLTERYSDKHPDVIRLAARIAKLEEEQAPLSSDTDPERSTAWSRLTEAQRLALAQREDLLAQLKLTDKEIDTLKEKIEKASREVAQYRRRIENGPKIEQMFVDLRRGYEEASENYQSLLEKKLQAQLAENLERTQQGEQFRVLDPADLPQRPFKPDVPKILSMGFMLALGCALGMAFFMEYLDPTFHTTKELERVAQLPVLVSVPVVNTKQERRRNWLKKARAVGALLSIGFILLYALFVLWRMDPTVFPIPLG